MTEFSAQSATQTHDCREPGCQDDAVVDERKGPEQNGGPKLGGFENRAKQLLRTARAVDRAVAAHKLSRARLDAAMMAHEEAKRQLSRETAA